MRLLPAEGRRRDVAIAIVLAAVAALFRLPRLGLPAEEVFDEVYHAKTALQYLVGENPTEWVHPPTAKLLIAVGVWIFGYKPWAWRLAPVLAGIALAPVFYAFARRTLVTERAALLASVILLADGVYEVQSRMAMTNIFAVLFQVASALLVVRAVLRDRLPVRGHGGGRAGPRPGPLHPLDEPLGLGLPGRRPPPRARMARCSARGRSPSWSWPSRRSPSASTC